MASEKIPCPECGTLVTFPDCPEDLRADETLCNACANRKEGDKMSKEQKHTPGPWGYTATGNGLMPEGMIGVGPTLENVALVETRHGVERGEANARLIAAAPELLAALEWLYRAQVSNVEGVDLVDAIEQARAALRKATEN